MWHLTQWHFHIFISHTKQFSHCCQSCILDTDDLASSPREVYMHREWRFNSICINGIITRDPRRHIICRPALQDTLELCASSPQFRDQIWSQHRLDTERLCFAVTFDLCRPQSSLSSLITCGIESLALILTFLQSLDCFAVQIWGDRGGSNGPESSVALLEGSSYCPGYGESGFSGKGSPKVADRSTGWE